MIAAILIGRENSTGFPGKNTYPLLGRPMAAYPLIAARDTLEIDRTYISTDSKALMDLGKEYGAEIIERPAELCTKEALGEHAYQHALEVITERLGEEPEILVLLMANAPMITPKILQDGIKALRGNPEYDSAVTTSVYNMWSPLRARRVNAQGLLDPFVPFETFGDPKTLNCDRDSQGDVVFANMSVSIVRARNLRHLEDGLLPQKWMGQKIYPLPQEGGLDVDYQWQLPQVEFCMRAMGFTEPA